MSGTYKGKSLRKGGGGQFMRMTDALEREGKDEKSAKAIAAAAGRKKYGAEEFAEMAQKGKARAESKRAQSFGDIARMKE